MFGAPKTKDLTPQQVKAALDAREDPPDRRARARRVRGRKDRRRAERPALDFQPGRPPRRRRQDGRAAVRRRQALGHGGGSMPQGRPGHRDPSGGRACRLEGRRTADGHRLAVSHKTISGGRTMAARPLLIGALGAGLLLSACGPAKPVAPAAVAAPARGPPAGPASDGRGPQARAGDVDDPGHGRRPRPHLRDAGAPAGQGGRHGPPGPADRHGQGRPPRSSRPAPTTPRSRRPQAQAAAAQADLARTRDLFSHGVYAQARLDQVEAQSKSANGALAAARAQRGGQRRAGRPGRRARPRLGSGADRRCAGGIGRHARPVDRQDHRRSGRGADRTARGRGPGPEGRRCGPAGRRGPARRRSAKA